MGKLAEFHQVLMQRNALLLPSAGGEFQPQMRLFLAERHHLAVHRPPEGALAGE